MRRAALLAVLLAGCTSAPQQLDPEKFYRNDLAFEVNGIKGTGVMVLPSSARYKIHGESAGRFDLLTVNSCHREFAAEKQGHSFDYEYVPQAGLETRGGCLLHFAGYEQKKGRHVWGVIDFQGPDAVLPAKLLCNGATVQSQGVSICQSRAGLLQAVEFQGAVKIFPDEACPMSAPKRPGYYEFPVVKGECVYAFREEAAPNRIHRLTTLGYEGILIREE